MDKKSSHPHRIPKMTISMLSTKLLSFKKQHYPPIHKSHISIRPIKTISPYRQTNLHLTPNQNKISNPTHSTKTATSKRPIRLVVFHRWRLPVHCPASIVFCLYIIPFVNRAHETTGQDVVSGRGSSVAPRGSRRSRRDRGRAPLPQSVRATGLFRGHICQIPNEVPSRARRTGQLMISINISLLLSQMFCTIMLFNLDMIYCM